MPSHSWGELRTNLASTRPEPPEAGYLVSTAPAEPTISRRGMLAFAGAGLALIALLSAGQSQGGPLQRAELLVPHGRDVSRPDDFQVNQTAASTGIRGAETGEAWRLTERAYVWPGSSRSPFGRIVTEVFLGAG
jgi:hypothetical protein